MTSLITAHSGADQTPENSLEFLNYALGCGADAVEADVRCLPSRLGEGRSLRERLVLSHNETDEEEDVVSLASAFERLKAAPAGIRFNCDLKEDGLEQAVYDLAKECGVSERILLTGSVSPERMRQANLLERVEVYLNIEEGIPELKSWMACAKEEGRTTLTADEQETLAQRTAELCRACRQWGITVLNAPHVIADERFLEILRTHEIGLSVWTVNDASLIEHFLREGVTNITTRTPGIALSLRTNVPVP